MSSHHLLLNKFIDPRRQLGEKVATEIGIEEKNGESSGQLTSSPV